MILKRDKKAKSLSYFCKDKFKIINLNSIFKFLKNKNKNISRVCIHQNSKSELHQMIIYQKKNYRSEIKYHPRKEKSYHLLKGKQEILIYKKDRTISKTITLNSKNNFFYMGQKVIHSNTTVSNESFHIETIKGPLDKKDRIYINEKK